MSTNLIVVVAIVILLLLVALRGRGGSTVSDLESATEEDIPRLLASGRKIDAIKIYRRIHSVDLKAAKEAVERLAAEMPPGSPNK